MLFRSKVLVALAIVLVAISSPDLFEGIRQFNSTVDKSVHCLYHNLKPHKILKL